jgi:hypothetical protein
MDSGNSRKFGTFGKSTSAPCSIPQFINISPQNIHQFENNPLSKQKFMFQQGIEEMSNEFY